MKTSAKRPHVTPRMSGATEAACRAAVRIIMLDGMAPVRRSLRNSDSYGVEAFASYLARIIDQECGKGGAA